MPLPPDFSEFLKLLNSTGARYLLIGGYAVNFYGYSRPTADLDIWIGEGSENAERVAVALRQFGFTRAEAGLFLDPKSMVRMGVPPLRLEILNGVSGLDFEDCYPRRRMIDVNGAEVPIISLGDLKINKRASGRHKDLADLDYLKLDD